MRVWSPGQEDPLEEETATHSSLLAWKNSTDRGTSWTTVHRVPKSEARLSAHTCVRFIGTFILFYHQHHTYKSYTMSYDFAAERSWGVHHNQGEAKTPASTSSCFLCLHLRRRPRWLSQEAADPQFPFSAHDSLKSSWSLDRGETCQLLSDEKIHRTY